MLLNIIDPKASSLHISLGISEQRAEEICKCMDEMTKGETRIVTSAEAYKQVASFCNTLEEFCFAISTHTIWLIKQNRLFLAAPLKYTQKLN